MSRAGLTVHLRQKHQEAKRNPIISHTCHVCGKAFIHESRLKMHMAIHAGMVVDVVLPKGVQFYMWHRYLILGKIYSTMLNILRYSKIYEVSTQCVSSKINRVFCCILLNDRNKF